MKNVLFIIIFLLSHSYFYSQQLTIPNDQVSPKNRLLLKQSDLINIPEEVESKILSGKLIQNISEKKYLLERGLITNQQAKEQVAIYVDEYPNMEQINSLTNLDINCLLEVWTPPLKNHPYGFFLAEIPVEKFTEALSLNFIKKIDTAEYENFPHNNAAVIATKADDVWLAGYDGTGVKVAVLDSGIDTSYAGTEFPTSFEKKDYSNYPLLDDTVANSTTGHGTHVAGSVLGRGLNSTGRSDEGNGSSPFKGSAPDADLVFLKIGGDASSSTTSAVMEAAMDAAVNIYNADILTMSYGGWYTYHDGSSSTEQKVDWVYSQGVPFFLSAGNSADDDQHYSGTVLASSSTDFIAINANAGTGLSFNLVWYDGHGTNNDLFLEFYNTAQVQYTTNITELATTESSRGTESKYSWYNFTVPSGTYYLKVVNNSSNSQFFHIYFYRQTTPVLSFANPDPFYTIGQPASADNGFAVGSYVSRDVWYASNGSGYWYGPTFVVGDIAPYSSRGPRVNGGVQKPNISAPGSAIISVRDTDVLTTLNNYWIDNDGNIGSGGANYYVMTGTSMACPIAAGCGALLLDIEPTATPQLIYNAIQNSASTSGTGTVPNNTWGYGKLDVLAASSEPLPVELSYFTAKVLKSGGVKLEWRTETEVDNYGFEILRSAQNDSAWKKIGFEAGHGNSNSPKEYSFTDKNATYTKYAYWLKQIDTDGDFEYSDIVEVDAGNIPNGFLLEQNYPNPFNPSTTIKFAVAETQKAELKVFDLLGNAVATLFDDIAEGGKVYEKEFNAEVISSGIYFYQLKTESKVENRKMLLIK